MKTRISLLALMLGTLSLSAQARKDCAELKAEIETQLQTKGVKAYQLEIMAKSEVGAGAVVGQCDGDTKRIVYRRGGAPVAAGADATKPAAPSNKTPPPLGNY